MNFEQHEYFFIFDSFIWPLALKLKNESLKSVSNLLKIFHSWSERPFFYPLFAIKLESFDLVDSVFIKHLIETQFSYYENFKTKNVLDILFELINSTNCSKIVVDYALEIVHNLVTYADFKPEEHSQNKEDYVTLELPFKINPIINKNCFHLDSSKIIYSKNYQLNNNSNFVLSNR